MCGGRGREGIMCPDALVVPPAMQFVNAKADGTFTDFSDSFLFIVSFRCSFFWAVPLSSDCLVVFASLSFSLCFFYSLAKPFSSFLSFLFPLPPFFSSPPVGGGSWWLYL